MITRMKSLLTRYRRNEHANMSVEAVILLPVLMWAFGAMFVFFDNFRAHSINQKAAYTIADMISRETDYITPDYLASAHKLLQLMSESNAQDSGLRITVVKYNASKKRYQRVWSRKVGAYTWPHSNTSVKKLGHRLPAMVNNEQLILVETRTKAKDIADVGILEKNIETFVFTRPRFAPQVTWSEGV